MYIYINTYTWDLEKMVLMNLFAGTYLQGRNRDTEVENGLMDMEEGEGGVN